MTPHRQGTFVADLIENLFGTWWTAWTRCLQMRKQLSANTGVELHEKSMEVDILNLT